MQKMKEVFGQDSESLDKVKLVDIEFFVSEYEGHACIGISTKGNNQGIEALCECLGIDLREFAEHLRAMSAAFGKTFSDTVEQLATKKDDIERMN